MLILVEMFTITTTVRNAFTNKLFARQAGQSLSACQYC